MLFMEKKLSSLLSAVPCKALSADGKTPLDLNVIGITPVTDIVFDSRAVSRGSLFFALPGHHTDGNKYIADAIENGANVIVYQGEISHDERLKIAKTIVKRGIDKIGEKELVLPVFLEVENAQTAMASVADAFYNEPSKKMIVIGVTGTEGKSSTVSFVWQLLRLAGKKCGFISTVQYSVGGDAQANPQHTTTPEAPVVQKYLYDMVQNGCEYAVVESSSHGLSKKLNRLGCVRFDCGIFMNVTLEHLEFHKTFDQYKNDKANLFRALDEYDHEKTVCNTKRNIQPFGVVNLEDPESLFFMQCTKQKVFGFTTEGMAGKAAAETGEDAVPLPKIPDGIPCMKAKNIAAARFGISFSLDTPGNSTQSALNADPAVPREHQRIHVTAELPGAFNAYNIMASLTAVSGVTGLSFEELAPLVSKLKPVTGRMTAIDKGQDFEVIVDYAHTPSSFETIFPPVKKRCEGRLFALFGSAGERDVTKRPLQGEIAGKFCDVVVLADEDPRGEDSSALLNDIADGCRNAGKKDGIDLFIIPDRPAAIRKTFAMAQKGDIVLLLGKGHENSIIYKDYVMPYDEIAEAEKALRELSY